jgi:hypothetical protein
MPANKSKILIHFEGIDFGWCVENDTASTIENCYKYTQDQDEDWGSSNNLPTNLFYLFGMLNDDTLESPGYYGWTKVVIKSCDGTGFQGYRSQPVVFKREKVYFRGHNNTLEALRWMNNTLGLYSKFTDILLTGSLNGAIAAMQWSDFVKQHAKGKVSVLADAAVYRDQLSQKINHTNDYLMRNKLSTLVKFVNQEVGLPSAKCQAAYKDEPWRCMFTEYLYPFVEVPVMFTASLYDAWSIIHVLGFECTDLYTISPCPEDEQAIIQEYKKNITALLELVTKDSKNGAWGVSCVAHDFVYGRWNNEMYTVPGNSSSSAANVTLGWYLGKPGSHVVIDDVLWPHNVNCAHKL